MGGRIRCAKSAEPLTCPTDHEARDGHCVRTAGQAWCEPGHPWNGKECSGYEAAAGKKPDKSPDEVKWEGLNPDQVP